MVAELVHWASRTDEGENNDRSGKETSRSNLRALLAKMMGIV